MRATGCAPESRRDRPVHGARPARGISRSIRRRARLPTSLKITSTGDRPTTAPARSPPARPPAAAAGSPTWRPRPAPPARHRSRSAPRRSAAPGRYEATVPNGPPSNRATAGCAARRWPLRRPAHAPVTVTRAVWLTRAPRPRGGGPRQRGSVTPTGVAPAAPRRPRPRARRADPGGARPGGRRRRVRGAGPPPPGGALPPGGAGDGRSGRGGGRAAGVADRRVAPDRPVPRGRDVLDLDVPHRHQPLPRLLRKRRPVPVDRVDEQAQAPDPPERSAELDAGMEALGRRCRGCGRTCGSAGSCVNWRAWGTPTSRRSPGRARMRSAGGSIAHACSWRR